MAEAPANKSPSKGRTARSLPAWLQNRDWALLGLLACLNVASAYTTIIGARQILPQPMSDIIGIAVQAMLFLMLAGFAVREAVVRKWVVVSVFAAFSIYTSFFCYYQELAKDADDKQQLDVALQTHAGFVSAIYQPARSRIETLDREAEALFELAEREAKRGTSTGVSGYGPVAKKYAEDGSAKKIEAEGLQADLDRLEPHFEYEMTGLAPEDVYRKDLEAWQLAPASWKTDVPKPVRDAYVDAKAAVALLTPYHRVRDGEIPAILALSLASLVDGIAIFLGTAIHARQRPMVETWSHQVASFIQQFKSSGAVVRAAMDRPPVSDPRHEAAVLQDALQIVDLRIAGRGSDFLITFYQAIHPETGALDFAGLQRHPNATYRIAARMLVDQLRNPQLGWVMVEEGWWCVPEDVYPSVTAWLGEHIRRECELETDSAVRDPVQEPERTLRLVIPAT
jgi:hypothetical protein